MCFKLLVQMFLYINIIALLLITLVYINYLLLIHKNTLWAARINFFKNVLLFVTGYSIYYLYAYFKLLYIMTLYYLFINIVQYIWYFYIFSIIYVFMSITFISIIFTIMFYTNEIYIFLICISIIFIGSQLMLISNNFFIFFVGYELLLIPSFLILYKYAKTYRCVEAAYIMFFWTQFGSFFIILVLLMLSINYNTTCFTDLEYLIIPNAELKLMMLLLLVGFGVKMPIWPFYGWLPKAHVEASTNFSIFLSGVLVKLAFLGLLKFLLFLNTDLVGWYIYAWMLLGIIEVSQKLFYQTDLKKIIALTTVIEMHWLVFTIFHTTSILYYSALLMFISHALVSSLFFILVDCISRRFKTRNIYEITGLWLYAPVLSAIILISNIIFLGFPYTSLFISEYLFFLGLVDINPAIFIFFIVFIYFINPVIIFRSWVIILYGKSWYIVDNTNNIYDITLIELLVVGFLIVQLVIMGIFPIINVM